MLAATSLFCDVYALPDDAAGRCAMGTNGVVWTVTQSGVIFPFLFGVIFYSVPVTMLRGLGMVTYWQR